MATNPSPGEAVLYITQPTKDLWARELRAAGVRLQVHPDVPRPQDITWFIGWLPPTDFLHQFPNLSVVQSLGAGVDHVLREPGQVPSHATVLRIVDPLMAERMAMWALWGVVNAQRRMDAYLDAQRARRWDKGIENYRNIDNAEFRVGVMGLGVMGGAVADTLLRCGYPVSGWARTPRTHDGLVATYAGAAQLREFVSRCDVLICMLPLTPETEGIINAELLGWLPRGAHLINGARGGHMVEPDLLAALDSGQVGSALLDVFAVEPLPESSPLWTHKHVRITPHVASFTNVQTAVEQVAENMARQAAGEAWDPARVVDKAAGY